MNPQAIITLLILMSVALLLITAFFGYAVWMTVKDNRDTEGMKQRAKDSQDAFFELNMSLAALN